MFMKEITIKIEVSNIEVDPDRYFSFDYVPSVNGKRKRKIRYESDFDNQTASEWKKALNKKEALTIALQDFTQNFI